MNRIVSKMALLSAMVLLIFSACQKDNEQATKVSKNEKSGANGYLPFKDELKILKDAFTPLSNDATLRRIIYKEVAKKFDGEYNVLIKTLIDASKKENYDLEGKLNENMPNGQNVQTLLSSFIRKGKQRYAHLYIPSFDKVVPNDLKSGKVLNVRGYGYPTLISRTDNEAQIVFEGTMYNGSTYQTVSGVDEPYSLRNEVWVMSVNERVDALARYNPNPYPSGTGGQIPIPKEDGSYCRNGDDGTRENLLAFEMSDLLEPWIDGGPEMVIVPLDMGSLVSSQIPKKLTL
jgi:hypothetical protein